MLVLSELFWKKERKADPCRQRFKAVAVLSAHIQKVILQPSYAITQLLLHFWSSAIATFLESCPENLANVEKGRLTLKWAKEAYSGKKYELNVTWRTGRNRYKKRWLCVLQCCQREGICFQVDKRSAHFCNRKKVGEEAEIGQRAKGRAKHSSHCQQGELGTWWRSSDSCCWEDRCSWAKHHS